MISSALLQYLREQTVSVSDKAQARFGGVPEAILQHNPAPGAWSAIQCLEHLNTYGRHYLPALDKAITKAKQRGGRPAASFNSSWLGAYFTKLMQPQQNGTLRSKMKSPKDHLPAEKPDAGAILSEFIQQQVTMLQLLERAREINMQKAKVPTSLSRFIKLSVGDTFSFVIAHINRHVLQAENAIAAGKQQHKQYTEN
ncbi:MAG TPA: DinB family protein [Chitinophaga sp.]|uniref:DinB family protein n=1 Tax=Chitinophaga sp. TaxID=1869181 RepID=UPI002B9529C9|nr:DinB family protein [Chitinophaga sp.]HVI43591.1 DinB family protein [Chitinophaga sp.]